MTDLQPTPTTDAAAVPAAARAPRPARVKIVRRPVHGVLLLDKPLGLSSNDALQKAKWLLRAEKAGHTGTLDPLATGLLPLCFGAATKFAQVSLDSDKAYRATDPLRPDHAHRRRRGRGAAGAVRWRSTVSRWKPPAPAGPGRSGSCRRCTRR